MNRTTPVSRRAFVQSCGATAIGALLTQSPRLARAADSLPSARVITRGPKHHWFGYYDKLQFDPTDRLVLGMQVDFEHRSPLPDDAIRIGMVDTADGDRWIELGQSTAWGWQQGCMLQWIPGKPATILWNDLERDRYVCRLLNIETRERNTIDTPIYALSPDGRTAISTDFRRINDVRPGYGYAGLADPHAGELAPKDSGIWQIDLESGRAQLIVSIAEVASLGKLPADAPGTKHYFNHLLFNPDGSRFVFLHRWRFPDGSRRTRMLTARPDGSELRMVDGNGMTSHFIWRDADHILAYSDQQPHGRGFYLFEDRLAGKIEPIGQGVLAADGHCSYLPGGEWILSDTYPDRERMQRPHLFEVATQRVVPLGAFRSPAEYTGEWRCDTHPRTSRCGKLVCIDSPVESAGRQMHLIDFSGVV